MTKISRKALIVSEIALLLGLAAVLPAAAQAPANPVQTPVDTKKLYAEIAGDYDFLVEGQSMIVNFFERDGSLYGAPPGETPELLVPVKDNPLKFEVTVAESGAFFALEFARNDKGEIDKCLLKTEGIEATGTKIKKGGF
jgi:hypothetical protein